MCHRTQEVFGYAAVRLCKTRTAEVLGVGGPSGLAGGLTDIQPADERTPPGDQARGRVDGVGDEGLVADLCGCLNKGQHGCCGKSLDVL